MLWRLMVWVVGCLLGCAEPGASSGVAVVDLRQAGIGGGTGFWEGDYLIVDSPCVRLSPLAGVSLDEACDVLMGGTAHVGEDRVAATVFDDVSCEHAAGFLPPSGEDGSSTLPHTGHGVILRCMVEAEPS